MLFIRCFVSYVLCFILSIKHEQSEKASTAVAPGGPAERHYIVGYYITVIKMKIWR